MDTGPEYRRRACILIGLPGCGKSTWTEHYRSLRPTTVLSTDTIIERKAQEVGKTYSEIFDATIADATKEFDKALGLALINGDDNIVIDRTNLTIKGRKQYVEKFNLHGYNVYAIVFPQVEEKEWKKRLENRPGKTIPDEVLKSMVERYEEPTTQEGFTEVIKLT